MNPIRHLINLVESAINDGRTEKANGLDLQFKLERNPEWPSKSISNHRLFALLDGEVVGVAEFVYLPLNGKYTPEVDVLWVRKDMRRRGIGTALVNDIKMLCGATPELSRKLSPDGQAFARANGVPDSEMKPRRWVSKYDKKYPPKNDAS